MKTGRLFNYLNLGRKLLLAKFSRPWPISVSFNVTRFCNLKCTHCYALLDNLDQPDATLEQLLDVVDGLHKRGTLSIRLLGGEPLMRKDLPAIIKRIKSNGMFCEIVTNGLLVRKKIADWPELKMVDSFCVSLDGDKELHDKLRGKGVFEKTIDGINALLEAEYPVRIHAALAKESYDGGNQPHLYLADLSQKHGINFNIATYCPNPGKGKDDAANRQSYLFSKKVYEDLLKLKKQGASVSTTQHILEKGIEWFEHTDKYIIFGSEKAIPKGYRKCQAGYRNCFIDSDGGMYSCIPHWGQGLSVFEVGLDKAYEFMAENRNKNNCQICYNLAQWEYTTFFSFSDPKLLLNMARNIFALLRKRKGNLNKG